MNMIWRQLIKNRLAVLGLIILFVMILSSLTITLFVDHSQIVSHNMANRLAPMSIQHPFGTDSFGRDLLTRLIYGTRISMSIGVLSVLGAVFVGGAIGSLSGYYGGKFDIIVMRFMDMLMAIPSMLLAIVIVSALGGGFRNLLLAIMVAQIPQFALIVRSSVLTIKSNEFIEAARAGGISTGRIIARHILPNAMGPIIVQTTISLGGVILIAASLSFIGLGVSPPDPEWGAILTEGQMYMRDHPNLVIFPGLTIMLAVLACNFLGDGLRDALDPKLKQ
jgi:peptide/nickel transport system permease protein